MKLAFFPGRLFLDSKPEGGFELRFGEEVRFFRSARAAVKAFNELRAKLEKEFPSRELTLEERRALLHKEIAESGLRQSSMRNAGPRKKTGTRTFG